jgi:hypothetical protein
LLCFRKTQPDKVRDSGYYLREISIGIKARGQNQRYCCADFQFFITGDTLRNNRTLRYNGTVFHFGLHRKA